MCEHVHLSSVSRCCSRCRCMYGSDLLVRDRHRNWSVNVHARMRVTWRHDDVVCAAGSVGADSSLGRLRLRPRPRPKSAAESAAADGEPSAAARQSRKTCTPRATSTSPAGHRATDLLRPAAGVRRRNSSPVRTRRVCRTRYRRIGV